MTLTTTRPSLILRRKHPSTNRPDLRIGTTQRRETNAITTSGAKWTRTGYSSTCLIEALTRLRISLARAARRSDPPILQRKKKLLYLSGGKQGRLALLLTLKVPSICQPLIPIMILMITGNKLSLLLHYFIVLHVTACTFVIYIYIFLFWQYIFFKDLLKCNRRSLPRNAKAHLPVPTATVTVARNFRTQNKIRAQSSLLRPAAPSSRVP